MIIYSSLIRSSLDCRCMVDNSASSREQESLESVSNEAMRKASGCFKSTPISSFQVITEEPPLQIRRDKLSLKYLYKVKSLQQNPSLKFITPEKETHKASRRQEKLIPFPYQNLFSYINDAIHQKLNTEWNQRNDKLKEIKPNTRPWKENNRSRKGETVINRLRAGHILLTHGFTVGWKVCPGCI